MPVWLKSQSRYPPTIATQSTIVAFSNLLMCEVAEDPHPRCCPRPDALYSIMKDRGMLCLYSSTQKQRAIAIRTKMAQFLLWKHFWWQLPDQYPIAQSVKADDIPTLPPKGSSPIPTGNQNCRPVAPHSVVPPSPEGFGRYVMSMIFSIRTHAHTQAFARSELTNVLCSTPCSRRFSVATVCPNCPQGTQTRREEHVTVFTLAN